MPLTQEDRQYFSSVLPAQELIDQSAATFTSNTVPWSLSYDQRPSLSLVPSSLTSFQAVIKYLYEHEDIDFAIRGRGVGSASAQDVVVSMSNWTDVVFDQDQKTVDIGAGSDWGDVDTRLATLVRWAVWKA